MPRKADGYTLVVTAGPSRDPATHVPVPVNTERPLRIDTALVCADLVVRVQGFRNAIDLPTTSPYFTTQPHRRDKYSISLAPLRFKPVATGATGSINGDDLVLGNDFDHSIARSLPPGFGVAWRIARWTIDPGLDGDPWADRPWIEGRVLSSVNVLDVGERAGVTTHGRDGTAPANNDSDDGRAEAADVISEGLHLTKLLPSTSEDGGEDIGSASIPHDSAARMKFFVAAEQRRRFAFLPDTKYWLDFFNPYVDFNDFALHLPGISIPVLQYWDGQPLRYILKNRVDQTVYLVVQFTLVPVGGEDDEGDEDDSSSEEEGQERGAAVAFNPNDDVD